MVTLAAVVAITNFGFLNTTWGGGQTGSPVPELKLLGLDLGPRAGFRGLDGNLPSPVFGWVALAVTVGVCLTVAAIRRGDLGRRMLAVRSNERAAAAAAIDPRKVKLIAFGISAAIAGLAGSLYAYNFGSVSADRFDVFTALSLIAFAYAGGITLISGAVFAGLISTQALFPYALDKWFGINGNWFLLFGGVILIVTLIQNPEGVAGAFYKRIAQATGRAPARARRVSLRNPARWPSPRDAWTSRIPLGNSAPARGSQRDRRRIPALDVPGPGPSCRDRARSCGATCRSPSAACTRSATSTWRSARASCRPDRTQRRRQDDADRRDHRLRPVHRARRARRPRHRALPPYAASAPWARANVAEHRSVRRPRGRRERDRGGRRHADADAEQILGLVDLAWAARGHARRAVRGRSASSSASPARSRAGWAGPSLPRRAGRRTRRARERGARPLPARARRSRPVHAA